MDRGAVVISAPVRLQVVSATTGAALDRQVVELRRVLRDARIPAVRATESPPDGTKADVGLLLGALTITFPAALEMLPALLAEVRSWVSRSPQRRVVVSIGDDSIDVVEPSAADQTRLIDAFIARHSTTPPAGR